MGNEFLREDRRSAMKRLLCVLTVMALVAGCSEQEEKKTPVVEKSPGAAFLLAVRGGDIKKEMENRGISVKAASASVLAEEADPAYKDVDEVVEVSHALGIATYVAKLVPLGVVKG